MTKDKPGPDEPAMELNEETVADLDTAADPAGGRLAMASSKDFQRCWSDEMDDKTNCA